MKIYGIYEGCQYEGGGVKGILYTKKEDAETELIWLIFELNKHFDKDEEYKWVRADENVYKSGTDIICIQEFELK